MPGKADLCKSKQRIDLPSAVVRGARHFKSAAVLVHRLLPVSQLRVHGSQVGRDVVDKLRVGLQLDRQFLRLPGEPDAARDIPRRRRYRPHVGIQPRNLFETRLLLVHFRCLVPELQSADGPVLGSKRRAHLVQEACHITVWRYKRFDRAYECPQVLAIRFQQGDHTLFDRLAFPVTHFRLLWGQLVMSRHDGKFVAPAGPTCPLL
ncbi:hypothetical protein SMC1_08255 [Candidatus Cryosericum septentrionale]|uniref:Uncharacterized protein n=1 Tax=Candidatus Cryosericum septentrionale TaxID=2290913 RepID=A0A398DLZ4_9BACT|nr:hypothetical protein SMC1_08255 [Candidatus Cryosericum septentrionale]